MADIIQNNTISSQAVDQANGPVSTAPAPGSPLTTAVNSLNDLSHQYALTNGTVYDMNTGKGFATPQEFFTASGVNSFNGLKFNTSYTPPAPTAADSNAVLNNAQDSTFKELLPIPGDVSDLKNHANDLITSSLKDQQDVQDKLNAATTGPNDLRTQATNKYNELGITKLQDDVQSAQEALSKIDVQQNDNLSQREDQYAGGGTESFAKTLDTKDQRNLAIQRVAAATTLAAAQQRLSSQIDVFKVFNQASSDEQARSVSSLSTQLGLDKSDLSAGLNLLSQAMQEAHGDETAARQLVATFATNVPGLFQALSLADQQNLSQGKITPTILSKVGELTLTSQKKLEIAQQNANVGMSNAFGQAYGLGQFGGPTNGTQTEKATADQQRIQISQQRLEIARNNAVSGGSIDSQATAQAMADGSTSLNSIPPELKGYFQEKRDALGNSFVVSKVAKNQTKNFATAWTNYWKTNSSPSYQPNTQASSGDSFDAVKVASSITTLLAANKGWQDIRAGAMSDGVPLTVYQNAVKQVLSAKK